jgi:hypothetical protein
MGTVLATAPLGWDNLVHDQLLAPAPVVLQLPAGSQDADRPHHGDQVQPDDPDQDEDPGHTEH